MSGKKISRWLGPNETMNSVNFVKTIWSAGVPQFLKKHKLKLLQDNAPPHISASTKDFMEKENVKVEFTQPTSPGGGELFRDDKKACRQTNEQLRGAEI